MLIRFERKNISFFLATQFFFFYFKRRKQRMFAGMLSFSFGLKVILKEKERAFPPKETDSSSSITN